MGLVSILDSFYNQVVTQMAAAQAKITVPVGSVVSTINQPFGGLVNAQDWPQMPVINQATPEGTLYLLHLNTIPHDERSQTQVLHEFLCQWVWVLLGQDIQSGQQGLNRGDRYRTNIQIQDNLTQAHYPGFCRRLDFTVNTEGDITSKPSSSEYPYSPIELVTWNDPKFIPKLDNQRSGLIYGAAQVSVFGYSDVLASIA